MDIRETIKSIIGFSKDMQDIAKLISKSKRIGILGHREPDMDCIGSQIALTEALKKIGKDAYSINNGPFDKNMSEYIDYFVDSQKQDTDLFIVVDNSSIDRISSDNKIDLTKTVVIDHHFTNTGYGIVNYVDDSFVSASEMVFILIAYIDISLLDKSIVQMILNGILSDNGYYKHIRTDKYFSLMATYMLVSLGGDPKLSYSKMFCNNVTNEVKLLGLALERLETDLDSKVVWSYISESDKKLYNADIGSSGIFKEMMSIKKGKVFVFFKITESENKVSVSLRSDDDIDVATIAAMFGGGGHKVASGVMITGTYDEVKNKILSAVSKLFI